MEAVSASRDDEGGGVTGRSGEGQSSGSQPAESGSDGHPHRKGRDVGARSEDEGVSRAEGVVEDLENAAREAEGGAIFGQSQIREGDATCSQAGRHDLQSTMQLGEVVENDAHAVAKSLVTLLASLKSSLAEVTGSSTEHMRVENGAAGQVQDAAINAATKGNRFINACLRLNEEMKGMNQVASQLESLKQKVDQFEHQSNRYLPRH